MDRTLPKILSLKKEGNYSSNSKCYALINTRTSLEMDRTLNIFPIIMGGLKFPLIIPKTKYFLANLYEYFLKNVKVEGMAHKRYLLCPS